MSSSTIANSKIFVFPLPVGALTTMCFSISFGKFDITMNFIFVRPHFNQGLTCVQNIVKHFGLDVIEVVDVRKYRTIFRGNLTQIPKFGHIDRCTNIYMEKFSTEKKRFSTKFTNDSVSLFNCTKWMWSTSRRHMVDLHTIADKIECNDSVQWAEFSSGTARMNAYCYTFEQTQEQEQVQRVRKMLRVP